MWGLVGWLGPLELLSLGFTLAGRAWVGWLWLFSPHSTIFLNCPKAHDNLNQKICPKIGRSHDSNSRPASTTWGSHTTAPYVSSFISVEINLLTQYTVRANRCQHPIGSAVLAVKNTWIVGIYSFDLELNLTTSISSSYIIRFRRFFLIFSKITLFSLMKFFCTDSILQILFMSIYLVPQKYRLEKEFVFDKY
jgi:hypothetical protein